MTPDEKDQYRIIAHEIIRKFWEAKEIETLELLKTQIECSLETLSQKNRKAMPCRSEIQNTDTGKPIR
jgi:hypothetical protein